jgi:hypothetical protein
LDVLDQTILKIYLLRKCYFDTHFINKYYTKYLLFIKTLFFYLICSLTHSHPSPPPPPNLPPPRSPSASLSISSDQISASLYLYRWLDLCSPSPPLSTLPPPPFIVAVLTTTMSPVLSILCLSMADAEDGERSGGVQNRIWWREKAKVVEERGGWNRKLKLLPK